jgi:hypothetical protein
MSGFELGPSVAAGGQAASGIASLAGGIYASEAASNFARYSTQLGEVNARAAIESADAEADRIRFETSQQISTLHAQLTSSGVRMSGTPIALLAQETAKAAYLVRVAKYRGTVGAAQARQQASLQTYQYNINADEAFQAGLGGMLAQFGAAGGTLLGGQKVPSNGTSRGYSSSVPPTSGLGDAYVSNGEFRA